jgi:phthiocerol/phenolphthiocerol synthesis type-I polyketide synthase D
VMTGDLLAHGTGTRLGDMIEMEAIKGVFGGATNPREYPLILSSSKTVLGHTQAAAALAGT